MLGESISSVSWPECGEIDIMEMIGGQQNQQDNTVHFNTHWNNHGHVHYGTKLSFINTKLHNDWHIYETEWNHNYIIGRIDSVEYYRLDISNQPHFKRLSQGEPMFLLLNMAVGGRW